MIKILDFTLLILYARFIYWLSDKPSLPVPRLFSPQDKIRTPTPAALIIRHIGMTQFQTPAQSTYYSCFTQRYLLQFIRHIR